jgi:hypothetical protein
MVSKRIMASCLALVMVLGMSLNSFAAEVTPNTKTVSRVSISDFQRLLNVCNEKYGQFTKKTKYADEVNETLKEINGKQVGVVEPVGPDETPHTGKTVTIDGKSVKLTSIHDFAGKVNFVNGKRLSNTEFVIRVEADDTAAQTFRGDYYVSVIPYEEKTVTRADGTQSKEAVNVPDEKSAVNGNSKFGPAWFYCMLFNEAQPEGKQDIVGYLVAQRITRWPDKEGVDKTRFYFQDDFKMGWKDGVQTLVPTPTKQAKDAFAAKTGNVFAFPDVFKKYGVVSYDAESKTTWYDDVKGNVAW